jgi:hypothetical protein
VGQRRSAAVEKSDVLSQLRSMAVRAGSQGNNGGARRSLSLKRNLSNHLDQVGESSWERLHSLRKLCHFFGDQRLVSALCLLSYAAEEW